MDELLLQLIGELPSLVAVLLVLYWVGQQLRYLAETYTEVLLKVVDLCRQIDEIKDL